MHFKHIETIEGPWMREWMNRESVRVDASLTYYLDLSDKEIKSLAEAAQIRILKRSLVENGLHDTTGKKEDADKVVLTRIQVKWLIDQLELQSAHKSAFEKVRQFLKKVRSQYRMQRARKMWSKPD